MISAQPCRRARQWIGACALACLAPLYAQEPAPAASLDADEAPIIVWNREIAVLRAPFGETTAAERATGAMRRIDKLLEERPSPAAIEVSPTQIGGVSGALVLADSQLLFGIQPADLPAGSTATPEQAAEAAAARLRQLVTDIGEQRRGPRLVQAILLALGATVAFGLVWAGILRLRNRLQRRLTGVAAGRSRGLVAFGFDFEPILLGATQMSVALIAAAAVLASAYAWLTFVFSRFHYTQPWADELGGFVIDALTDVGAGIVSAVPNLIMVLIIALVARAVVRVLGRWCDAAASGAIEVAWLDPHAARTTRKLLAIGVWLFALIVAYPHIPGSNTDAFKGVSVFLGLVISLGSTSFVNQIMSGLALVYARGVRPGEFVTIDDIRGRIREVGLLATRVVTRTGEEVTIPNAVVIGTSIRNRSRAHAGTALLTTSVTIGYNAPWRQVHALLLGAATRTDGVLKEPAPRVLQTALSDFFVEYELVVHIVADAPAASILSTLHGEIQDAFNESGVQIMSPHFEGQPENAVLVPRDRWHAAPPPRTGENT